MSNLESEGMERAAAETPRRTHSITLPAETQNAQFANNEGHTSATARLSVIANMKHQIQAFIPSIEAFPGRCFVSVGKEEDMNGEKDANSTEKDCTDQENTVGSANSQTLGRMHSLELDPAVSDDTTAQDQGETDWDDLQRELKEQGIETDSTDFDISYDVRDWTSLSWNPAEFFDAIIDSKGNLVLRPRRQVSKEADNGDDTSRESH